jgi:hypothetical protein
MTNRLLKNLIIFAFLALFFIPLNQAIAANAQLKISSNDGAQCFLNGQEIFNNLTQAQSNSYWNKTVDVKCDYFRSGQNFLACRVSNGDGNSGTGQGYFDVELVINSQTVISKGSTDWRYFGSEDNAYSPPNDSYSQAWYDINYNDSYWSKGDTPFDGKTDSILKKAPDNAWFRKNFSFTGNACYGLSSCSFYDDSASCLSVPNCSWNGSFCYTNYNTPICAKYNDRNSCLANSSCSWSGSYCLEINLVSCSTYNNQTDCSSKLGCYWNGSYCAVSSTANCSLQNNRTNCLNSSGCIWTGSYCVLNSMTNCSNFTDQLDCQNKAGCSWNGSYCTSTQYIYDQTSYRTFSLDGCFTPRIHNFDGYKMLSPDATEVSIVSARPLVTGLVKYGNTIEIFIDNKSAGEAVVKEGEYSGIANFYFKPKANSVDMSQELTTHTIKLVATNPRDNSVCSTNLLNFVIIPYPAPVIHRLGEISYVERANLLTINTRNPLVTGLVKYGSLVEMYVDDKMVGNAKVKEGERTGVANFYMTLPKLNAGQHTLYTIAKKAGQEEIESAPSQVYTFTVQ